MKTFKLLNSLTVAKRLVTPAIVITAALTAGSALAVGVGANLTLTENSSTSLSLSYTGPTSASAFTVLPQGTDSWIIQVSSLFGPIFFNDFSHDWAEPEDPTQAIINEVRHLAANDTQSTMFLFVRSDLDIAHDANGIGGISPDNTSFIVGTDSGVPIFLTFHDLAAANEAGAVPEIGSTLGLFALSAVGLFGANRLRRVQLA